MNFNRIYKIEILFRIIDLVFEASFCKDKKLEKKLMDEVKFLKSIIKGV